MLSLKTKQKKKRFFVTRWRYKGRGVVAGLLRNLLFPFEWNKASAFGNCAIDKRAQFANKIAPARKQNDTYLTFFFQLSADEELMVQWPAITRETATCVISSTARELAKFVSFIVSSWLASIENAETLQGSVYISCGPHLHFLLLKSIFYFQLCFLMSLLFQGQQLIKRGSRDPLDPLLP